MPEVNSLEWWEARFEDRWESDDGPGQTRHFMELLLASLPPTERMWLRAADRSILDWGCALGDGVEALAHEFPHCHVSGLDFSPTAIARARERFTKREFLHSSDGEIPRPFNVIVCSNCLEHFTDPIEVIQRQLPSCTHLYVAMVPYNEEPLHASHVQRFDERSFPDQIDGFARIAAVRAGADPRYWQGEQLIVVYASQRYRSERPELPAGTDSEQAKWDREYASIPLVNEDPALKAFNAEFVRIVAEMLPDGGSILEAGCGAGWQSLALARTGKYQVHLLDFSPEALKYARGLFAREGLEVSAVREDATKEGSPEFDLVFNAGVLEHYTHARQVALLKGMRSRSRAYVLTMVPNRECYWYWLWRVAAMADGRWTFGKEVPLSDLSRAFQEAGLHFWGQAYIGSDWTEQFIAGIPGMEPALRDRLIEIHRAAIVPRRMRSYLLATLGSVTPGLHPVGGTWETQASGAAISESELVSTASDALSLRLAGEFEIRSLRERMESAQRELRDQKERLESEARRAAELEQAHRSSEEARQALDAALQLARTERERTVGELARSREATHALFSRIRSEAISLSDLLESWRVVKSFRVARMMQLVSRELLHGPWRDRMHFLKGILSRMTGRRPQLSPLNIFETPMRQAMHIATMADQTLGDTTHLPTHGQSDATQLASYTGGRRSVVGRPRRSVVNIVNTLFLDLKGKELMLGGAERYVVELCRMIRDLGYTPEVYQCAHGSWTRTYDGVKVVGIDIGQNTWALNERFHAQVPPGALSIYSAFFLAGPVSHPNALGIGHGIFWDAAYFQEPAPVRDKWTRLFFSAIENCSKVVSVDTNTINWLRASNAKIAHKCVYVPNFVDTQRFKPADDGSRSSDKLVVLYPRRLYRPRGFYLLAELIPGFLARDPRVEFHFVGKADEPETSIVQELVQAHGGRVRWYHLEPDEMYKAYASADIMLVPTVESEGTSLSCLEAMASGNAVIATNVGGLPELVTDGYSGLLISPTAESLQAAIQRLLDDADLRRRLGENARQVALSYDIEVWRSRWRDVLAEALPRRMDEDETGRHTFVHLESGGVVWDRMKQRPHHVFRALAAAGQDAVFISDEPVVKVDSPSPNLMLLGTQDHLSLERPVLYIYHAFNYQHVQRFKDPLVLYDILDDPKIHDAGDAGRPAHEKYRYFHEKLLREADVVIASARVLHEQYREQRPDIVLVPNGVWPEDFRPARVPPRPADLPDSGGPVVGYYGAVAEWFDFSLLARAARQRPGFTFVLIGLTNRLPDVQKLTVDVSNIHYLGEKPYEQLPAYLAHFDVATIPFVVNDITNAVSPVKLFEYAAGGKPVVATAFEEVRRYPEVLVARDAEEFVSRLDEAIRLGRDEAYLRKLATLAEGNSWPDRAQAIVAAISAKMRPQARRPAVQTTSAR